MRLRSVTVRRLGGTCVAAVLIVSPQVGLAAIAVNGVCPGEVELSMTGAKPNAQLALFWAADEGLTVLPDGLCAGTELGLEGAVLAGTFVTDEDGAATLTADFNRTRCAIWIQALDVDTCGTSLLVRAPGELTFTDVTESAGVAFEQVLDDLVPIGAGAAWVDVDDDGWDDLYQTQGIGCNRLFLNQRDGTFSEVVDAAGASDCDSISHGVAAADFDNDGDQDLYVTNNGQNHLYRNALAETGELSFVDHTLAAGMDDDGAQNSSSAAWGDYDNDGYVDLVVGQHYIQAVMECIPDLLWHNEGDGTFTEVGADLGVAVIDEYGEPGCSLALTWSDYDGDLDADLMIVNDLGYEHVPNRLFQNQGPEGGYALVDISTDSAFDYPMFGMGIAIGDPDRDGDFDYYMTDKGANNLALNNGDDTFTEGAVQLGVEAQDKEIWLGDDGLGSWGTVFCDADLDGLVDLPVANGGAPADKFPHMFGVDYVQLNPIYWYRNQPRGPFEEGHERIGQTHEKYYRSVAVSDYDRDGDVDAFYGNAHGRSDLYRNDYPQGVANWLEVRVRGTVSNRDGIGTRIEAWMGDELLIREVDGGSSFLSRHSLVTHFGLASHKQVDRLVVTFPSGIEVELLDVDVNQEILVVEPAE